MIGTQTDAARVVEGEGQYIGEGHTRRAFLLNGVVYKVGYSARDNWYNELEHAKARDIRDMVPEFVGIPETSLYNVGELVVLAMTYVSGQPKGECIPRVLNMPCDCGDECLTEEIATTLMHIHEDSISFGNTILSDGKYYIIDLA